MEEVYVLKEKLRGQVTTLIRNNALDDDIINFIKFTIQSSANFDAKILEIMLELILVQTSDLKYNSVSTKPEQLDQPLHDHGCYDADDEGLDESFIFPCHITFDECHPELLSNYHCNHIRSNKTAQIVRYPKVCEFIINMLFKNIDIHLYQVKGRLKSDNSHKLPDEIIQKSCLAKNFSRHLDSIIAIVKKLNKNCLMEKKNCQIISRTNILSTILQNILHFLQEIPEKQHIYLEPMLKLVFTLADYKVSGDNLKQLFRILKSENVDLKVVLSNFEHLLSYQYRIFKNIQPTVSVNFPTASRTAEEIESDQYLAKSWHWKLRSKVIEFKRKRSRYSESLSSESLKYLSMKNDDEIFSENLLNNQSDKNSNSNRISPSILECSLMTPLSNISPLVQNGVVKFCCSMWVSVCGDLLVFDESKPKKASKPSESLSLVDWRNATGHWKRLTSRVRLSRCYRANLAKSHPIHPAAKIKRRNTLDREDEEQDEIDEQIRKSQIGISNVSHRYNGFRFPNHLGQANVRNLDKGSPEITRDKQPPPKEFLGRRARNNPQESLLHLVSFALDTMTIEIWLNVKCMTFCARACRIVREGQTNLIDQVTFPCHLETNGSWSHVLFSFEELNKGQTLNEKIMSLKVVVDGVHKEREKLIYSSHKSPLTNFACLIGCERSTYGYVWKLSQINIYKTIPTSDIILFLVGKGPDFWSFTDFSQQSTLPLPDITQRSVKNLTNPKILDLYGQIEEEWALKWLTQNIVISYAAHRPDYFLDYSPRTSSSIMNPLPVDHEFNNSAERFIQAKVLNFSRSLRFNSNHSFGSALVEAGGIENMLICFAEVVRRTHDTPDNHALALSTLFKMCQTNQYHFHKFLDELDGLKLTEFILVLPDCIVSKPMLDCYLDFCLMKKGEYSFIKSSKLFFHLISCWRAWHKDVKVAKLLYRRLIRLLQPHDNARRLRPEERKLENIYISYNLKMMTNAGTISILMGILRECLVPLDEDVPKINHDLVELIVNLISLLIKHPPGLDVMLDIMEFLLLLHPDPKSYIEEMSDRTSYLHELQGQNKEPSVFDEDLTQDRAIMTLSSCKSSIENIQYTPINGSILDNTDYYDGTTLKRSSNDKSLRSIDGDIHVDNMGKFANGYELDVKHKLDSDEGSLIWINKIATPEGRSNDLNSHRCSNRNLALANIADMLASIVKLISTDPMKILSEALQKPIIDPRKLIILANNSSSLVREKVLRLFLYCIRACYHLNLRPLLCSYEQDTKCQNFKQCLPIKLMAQQLLRYPTTIKMIQLCYGIIVGIDDFETVETVCLKFDIETINNNLQLNALILLIQLMAQLQDPKEILSTVKFVHAYLRQLAQLSKDEILAVLVKGNVIDSIMRIYFGYIEYVTIRYKNENYYYHSEKKICVDEYDEVREELDKTLILVVRYLMQDLKTSETIESIEDLLTYLHLLNSYVSVQYKWILRDVEVKVLTIIISYCRHYENCARQMSFRGKMEYYLKSLFKNNDINTFPNVLPESYLDMDPILADETRCESRFSDNFSTKGSNLNNNFRVARRTYHDFHGPKADPDCNMENENFDYSDPKKISESDVIDRFKATVDFAINFIITREPGVIPSPLERRFIIECVKMFSSYLAEYNISERRDPKEAKQKSHWHLMLPKMEPMLRTSFSHLILYLLSPCDSMNVDERKYYALKILELFSVDQLISLLETTNGKSTHKILGIFIKDLIDYNSPTYNSEASDSEQDDETLGDDTEKNLKLLIQEIEYELCSSEEPKSNGHPDKNKRAKMTDQHTDSGSKFRNVWMDFLSKTRTETKNRLLAFKESSLIKGSSIDGFNDDPNRILDEAISITRDVVNEKHEQRKAYLEDLKQNKVCNYYIRQQWLSLIIGHCHERAIWFMDSHYPKSWELNPVEGPSRIRRRLRPCKLMLDSRFVRSKRVGSSSNFHNAVNPTLLSHKQDRHAGQSSHNDLLAYDWYSHYSPHPLCSMIINHEQSMDSNELRIRMFTTDRIHFNCDCSIIRPNEVCEGEVSIASWCIHFIGDRSDSYQRHLNDQVNQQTPSASDTVDDSGYEGKTDYVTSSNGRSTFKAAKTNKAFSQGQNTFASTIVEDLWFDEIVEIWDRRYQLQDVSLEIFLTNSMTYLFSFRSNQDREDFKQNLMRSNHKMINLQRFNPNTSLNRLTQFWRDGRITNFDYLTYLNKLAGRSFNDLMQYPVFPFVLSNYSSSTLDLNDPSNFRKLNKPMAIQNQEKEAIFINNYHLYKSSNISVGPCGMSEPYHYGNHYSNSATVLHFLVRLPPFTQMMIQYQDNNFDQPDRTFHSIASTWQLITRDSNTDFKELIPEFFFLPEMFMNFEGFDLGCKQNNEIVDDVKLPAWCPNSDSRLFTLIHRQALESAYVSDNLYHWIDLIFGYKQMGKAAVDAINVFHPATYFGMIDLNSQQSSSKLSPSFSNQATNNVSAKSSVCSSDYVSNPDISPTGSSVNELDATKKNTSSIQSKHQQATIDRLALETMIKTYGQMPRQLFAQPLKQRSLSSSQTTTNKLPALTDSSFSHRKIEPLYQVRGLRWGSFVGSPDESDISAVRHERINPEEYAPLKMRINSANQATHQLRVKFRLCLLPNGEIAVLQSNTSLMLDYRADRKYCGYRSSLPSSRYSRRPGLSSISMVNLFSSMIISRQQSNVAEPASLSDANNTNLSSLVSLSSSKSKFVPESLSLISWSYIDGIIRIRHPALNNHKSSIPLVQGDSIVDTVTVCASVPELNLLLVGYTSGSICAHIVSTCYETTPIVPTKYIHSPETSQVDATLSNLHTSSSSSSIASDPNNRDSYSAFFFNKTSQSVRSMKKTSRWLFCHSRSINCMKINVSFGIIVTASDDGTSVIWDLNSLTYVRTIDYRYNKNARDRTFEHNSEKPSSYWRSSSKSSSNSNSRDNHSVSEFLCNCSPAGGSSWFENEKPVEFDDNSNSRQGCICAFRISLIEISDTLGDIVSVKDINNRLSQIDCEDTNDDSLTNSLSTNSNLSSVLYVHTINGSLVGYVNCHTQVTAVCYSRAPEGTSVNVILVGMANGLIQMYSSWDLNRVKEFHVTGLNLPIASVLYSRDNQLLYVAYDDGQLVVLRNKKKKTSTHLPKEWFL